MGSGNGNGCRFQAVQSFGGRLSQWYSFANLIRKSWPHRQTVAIDLPRDVCAGRHAVLEPGVQRRTRDAALLAYSAP